MKLRLQQIGDDVGLIVPVEQLRSLAVKAGDLVDLTITKNNNTPRQGWESPELWQGAEEEPLHLE